MTIQIIQRNEPEKQEKECYCTKCKSILLVPKEDTTYIPSQLDGNFWFYVCPVCHTGNYIHFWKN